MKLEIDRKRINCEECMSLKKKLRQCKDESDFTHELYLGQKQQFVELSHTFKEKVNSLQNTNSKLKIEMEEIQQEKRTIMRKLVHTMLKYDKETSFKHQAHLLNNTAYYPDQDYVSVKTSDGG